jgi:hypothetical protein
MDVSEFRVLELLVFGYFGNSLRKLGWRCRKVAT